MVDGKVKVKILIRKKLKETVVNLKLAVLAPATHAHAYTQPQPALVFGGMMEYHDPAHGNFRWPLPYNLTMTRAVSSAYLDSVWCKR